MTSEATIEAFSLLEVVLALLIREVCLNYCSWWGSVRSVEGSRVLHILIDLCCVLNEICQGCWKRRNQVKKISDFLSNSL